MSTSVSTKSCDVCFAKMTPTVLFPAPGMPIKMRFDRGRVIALQRVVLRYCLSALRRQGNELIGRESMPHATPK